MKLKAIALSVVLALSSFLPVSASPTQSDIVMTAESVNYAGPCNPQVRKCR